MTANSKHLTALVAAAAPLLLATGVIVFEVVSGADPSRDWLRRPRRPTTSEVAPVPMRPLSITLDGVAISGELPPPPAPAPPQVLIAHSMTINLVTDDFRGVRAAIDRFAADHRGTVVGVVASPAGVVKSMSVTVTIPMAQADAAKRDALQLGRVVGQSSADEDLTAPDRALQGRIETSRLSEQRLADRFTPGQPLPADPAAIERARERAHAETDRLVADESRLTARAAVLTLYLNVQARE